jgi:hypothetical protein
MGLLDKHRARVAEEAARREATQRSAAYATWYSERQQIAGMIEDASNVRGVTRADAPDLSLQLKKGETVLGVLRGCSLIEPRRGPGHYQGGYQGFSFKVTKGVRYHVGGSRGTFVQGDERPTPIDAGTVTITTQRVVFQGEKQAREWAFSKLLGVQHDPKLPWTAIQVSNRQKVSGFFYDDEHAVDIRFRLTLALAIFNDDTDALVADLKRQLSEHDAAMPPLPDGLTAPSPTPDRDQR